MGQNLPIAYIGLDNHKDFSEVTARSENNEIVLRRRLNHHDRQQMYQVMTQWPPNTPVILESSFGWGWMADALKDAGHDPHLANSRKVAAWRTARGLAKSNRIDADLLSELWPQQPHWWEVWMAPIDVRDQREILRYRMSLVQVQTMTKNRIHATLHRHGIVHGLSDLFGKKGMEFLRMLIEADEPLHESTRLTLEGFVKLLQQVRRQIAAVTRVIRRLVSKNPQAETWRKMPGISWILAYTIQSEIGDIGRFPDGDHLASYALLVPLANDSGLEDDGSPIGRHVGHAGRRTLKWAFIEAARGASRKSAFFRLVFDRHTNGGRKNRNRGRIAVARKLCVAGAACVKKGEAFLEVPPPRPGTVATALANTVVSQPRKEKSGGKKRKTCGRNSRSGLGQPDHPMVVAGI